MNKYKSANKLSSVQDRQAIKWSKEFLLENEGALRPNSSSGFDGSVSIPHFKRMKLSEVEDDKENSELDLLIDSLDAADVSNSDGSFEYDAGINEFLVVENVEPDFNSTPAQPPTTDDDGLFEDPAKWPERPLHSNEVNQAMKRGIHYFRHKDICPNTSMFSRFPSGTERTWLIYSPSAKKVFCFSCKVFRGNEAADRRVLVERGECYPSDCVLDKHEESKQHKKWEEMYKNRLDSSRNVTSFFTIKKKK